MPENSCIQITHIFLIGLFDELEYPRTIKAGLNINDSWTVLP
jgi:hypothetical protein